MKITKMHGAGNDFVIINDRNRLLTEAELSTLARELCAAHVGVGADGVMVVLPAEKGGDYAMRFYNSDGSEGEMCGNGARCIARYGYDHGLAGERQRIETISGTVEGERLTRDRYRLRLNDPSVIQSDVVLQADGVVYRCCYIEMGVPGLPHAVVPLPGFMQWDREKLKQLGREIRLDPHFPKGANVSFAEKLEENRFRAMTYERGVEEFTLACGSGSGSIAAAMCLWGEADGSSPITVEMPGGVLTIELHCDGKWARDIFLTGPTVTVFEGEWINI